MGAGPLFSVIIPAFEAEDRVGEAVGSVLGQQHADLELIVVDDGSTDRTAERARAACSADPRARVVSRPNGGTVAARNAGVAAAAGAWLCFLDDDDLWLPGHVSELARLADRVPNAGIVHTDAAVVESGSAHAGRTAWQRFGARTRRLPDVLDPDAAEAALLRVNFVTTCAAAVRSDAFSTVGGLDSALVGTDDWDLWLRVTGAGWGVARSDRASAVLRKRPDSFGSDVAMMAAGSQLTLERALERGTRTRRAARIARRHLRVIALERRALASGPPAGARCRLAGFSRRLGRKRLPPLRRR